MVIVCLLKWHSGDIGFDLTNIEEHVVDLFVGVGMRTAQVVALADSFLHLEAVVNGKRDIIVENRLHLAFHALDCQSILLNIFMCMPHLAAIVIFGFRPCTM